MCAIPLTRWTSRRFRIAVPAALLLFFTLPGAFAQSIVPPAAQWLAEIPVPLTIRVSTEQTRVTVTARVSETLHLVSIAAQPLVDVLAPVLGPGVAGALARAGEDGWVTTQELEALALTISFDGTQLSAVLEVPAEALDTRVLSVYERRRLPDFPVAENAAVAVGIPGWFLHRGAYQSGTDPATSMALRLSPGLYLYQWVLESDLLLDWYSPDGSSGESTREIAAENTRVIRTWEASGIRFQAGQVVQYTRGLQTPRQVLGVSLDNQQADTGRSVIPVIFDRAFVVDQPGSLEVFVNERRTRSFPVQPGQYGLENFPVIGGINTVRVVYVRADGEAEEFRLVVPHAGGLLVPREWSWAVSAGVEETGEQYRDPAGTGFLRYGLGDRLTVGMLADGSAAGGRTGMEAVAATALGEPLLAAYLSITEDGVAGWAAQAGYRFSVPARPALPGFTTTVDYRNPDFFSGGTAAAARPSWQLSSAVVQPLPGGVGLSQGHVYRRYHDEIDPTSFLYGSATRSLGSLLSLRVTGSAELGRPEESWAMTVTVSGYTRNRRFNGTASTDVRNATTDLSASAIRSGPVTVSGTVRARSISLEDGTVGGLSGSLRTAGQRFDVSGNGSLAFSAADSLAEQSFQSGSHVVQFGTGVYLAGKTVGLGAPHRGAFALLRAHADLPTSTVTSGNPARSSYRRSDALGPAVLGPLSAGTRDPLVIDVPGIPADFALGRTEYLLAPQYRSGTAITVAPSRRLYLRGRLLEDSGVPIPWTGLMVVPRFEIPEDLDDGIVGGPAFTDDQGVFEIYGVIPGEYAVLFRDGSGRQVTLVVPDDPGPLVIVEDIRVQGGF
jgi:outer membrane usher protein FimD/PapC